METCERLPEEDTKELLKLFELINGLLPSSCRALKQPSHMDLVVVVSVLVFARQESQVYLGSLVPRDQQVLRDRPARKDQRGREETKATTAIKEAEGPQAQRAHQEPKETRAIKIPRNFQVHCGVTGSSVCLKL